MAITNRVVTSVVNALAAATVTASSENATLVADNVKTPQEQFKPWLSTDVATDQWVRFDRGASPGILDYLHIVRTNFTSVRIQMTNDPTFVSLAYDQPFTISRSGLNDRFNYAMLLGRSERYLGIQIPIQTPVKESYVLNGGAFLIGGVFGGAILYPPLNFLYNIREPKLYPEEDIGPPSNAWDQTLIRGYPRAFLNIHRIARTAYPNRLTAGNLAAFKEYDRQLKEAGFFSFFFNDGTLSEAYMMKIAAGVLPWEQTRHRIAESEIELKEVSTT